MNAAAKVKFSNGQLADKSDLGIGFATYANGADLVMARDYWQGEGHEVSTDFCEADWTHRLWVWPKCNHRQTA